MTTTTTQSPKGEQLAAGLEIAKLREALVDEIKKGHDAHLATVADLEKRLDEAHEKLSALATAGRSAGPGIGAHPEDIRKASLIKMLAGHIKGWDKVADSDLERELCHETMLKAQESGVDTAGGFLVPGEFMAEMLIPLLEPSAIAISLGANVLDGLTGSPVEIPALRADATAYWVGEDEEITASEMTFGQIKMEPRGLATLIPITNRLLMQTSNRVEAVVREQLTRTLAKAVDLAFYNGSGGKQPTGVLERTGINSYAWSGVTFDATTVTAANAKAAATALLAMVGALEEDDALQGRPAWSMHPRVKRALMGVTDADGRPLLFSHSAGLVGQMPDQLMGFPYATSTQLSAGSDADLALINMQDAYIGFWQGLEIDLSNVAKDAFEKRLTYVRAVTEVDMNLGNPQSVCAATSLDVSDSSLDIS
jgi:HK97 family phage major capsid protein